MTSLATTSGQVRGYAAPDARTGPTGGALWRRKAARRRSAGAEQQLCAHPPIAELDSEDEDDGPLIEDGDEDDELEEEDEDRGGGHGGDIEMADMPEGDDSTIVLHDDKKYYPTALEVYGEDVRAAHSRRRGGATRCGGPWRLWATPRAAWRHWSVCGPLLGLPGTIGLDTRAGRTRAPLQPALPVARAAGGDDGAGGGHAAHHAAHHSSDQAQGVRRGGAKDPRDKVQNRVSAQPGALIRLELHLFMSTRATEPRSRSDRAQTSYTGVCSATTHPADEGGPALCVVSHTEQNTTL